MAGTDRSVSAADLQTFDDGVKERAWLAAKSKELAGMGPAGKKIWDHGLAIQRSARDRLGKSIRWPIALRQACEEHANGKKAEDDKVFDKAARIAAANQARGAHLSWDACVAQARAELP